MIDFHWNDIEALNETDPKLALLAAIGAIADMWASFEMTIDAHIVKMAGVERDLALCITSQIAGHGRKLDALISIAKLTHMNLDIKAINKFSQDTAGLARQRNRVIHDPWSAAEDGSKKRFEISAAKTFTFSSIPTELADLRDLHEKIWNARERLVWILSQATRVEPKQT